MEKTTLQITRKHINLGSPGKPERCPIAIALKDNGFRRAIVTQTYALLSRREYQGVQYFKNSKLIHNWMRTFDKGMFVEPFTLEIRLADSARNNLITMEGGT